MNRIEYWKQFIKSSDIDTLAKDLNNSWNPNTKTYDSYTPLKIELLNEIKEPLKDLTVLDFGCGLGNYLKDLQNFGFKVLTGFEADIPKQKVFDYIIEQDLTIPFKTFSVRLHPSTVKP